ncbi:MAG: stage III sporulation protein AD [Clostridiales bacterium]
MMESGGIFAVTALAVTAAMIGLFLKESKLPVLGLLIAIAAGAIIFLKLLPALANLFSGFQDIAALSGVNSYYVGLMLKIIGVAYIAEFGAQLCRDAGQSALAMKIEFAAKIGVMLMALPILAGVIRSVLALLT